MLIGQTDSKTGAVSLATNLPQGISGQEGQGRSHAGYRGSRFVAKMALNGPFLSVIVR